MSRLAHITASFIGAENRLRLKVEIGDKTQAFEMDSNTPLEHVSLSNGKWGYSVELNPTKEMVSEFFQSLSDKRPHWEVR